MKSRDVAAIAAFAALFFFVKKANADAGGAPAVYIGPVEDDTGQTPIGYHDPVYNPTDSAPVIWDVSTNDDVVQESGGDVNYSNEGKNWLSNGGQPLDPGTVPTPVSVTTDPSIDPNAATNTTDPAATSSGLGSAGDPSAGTIAGISAAVESARINAFLYMIRCAEHQYPFPQDDAIRYLTYYGNTQFSNTSDHPVTTGEKKGIRLQNSTCVNAGVTGYCVSTAAGAYQMRVSTWNWASGRLPGGASLPGGMLPDFSAASQDAACVRILQSIGAYNVIVSGDFTTAVAIAGQQWASLPGARAKQAQRSPEFVLARYNEAIASWGVA